jgi:RNA polymerase sigma-54 factor
MTAIVKIQKEYFLTEDVRRMRPMLIKDVAAMTGYDISVISRATNNKYAATPWGTFPLRFFFTDSFGEDGDELTNKEVAEIITSIVRSEDKRHPLSDERIREEMLAKGYDVSRRTVAKYRDREGIPVARLRKEM